MDAHQLHRAQWRTSTHSGQNGSCVQVAANLPGIVAIRDSKNPNGPNWLRRLLGELPPALKDRPTD